MTSQTTPEAGTSYYTYTSDDLVDYTENDRIVSGSTKYRASFSYNNRHQVTQVSYNDSDATPDVYYTYGEYGERTLMQEKNDAGTVLGSTTYSYDTYKRLQTETRVFNGMSRTYSVGYSYNNVDEVTQVRYTVNSWTKNVNYAYTYASALDSVGTNLISGASSTAATNVVNTLKYRSFGPVRSLNYGDNPRKLQIVYDPVRQQISNITVKKTDDTDTIINSGYDYYNGGNNNGRIQKITDNVDSAFTTTYGYDDYNRLTSASATNYTRSYEYDVWGNLREVTSTGNGETGSYTLLYEVNGSTAPATNQIANTAYSYDNAGSLTNDGVTAYTYDAANRLKTAGSSNSYGYDGDGRRVKQQIGSAQIYYLWSSVLGQAVVEIDGSNASNIYVYRAYVYGGGSQALAVQSYDGGFYWVHSDHLGNGRKLTDVNGAVVYRGEFDPHGQAVYEWATGGATYLNSKKFTGYERDWATNLDNAQARMYYHNRGRFMQADPLGMGASNMADPQSLNLYSYVENDLMNSIDPSGLEWIKVTECHYEKTSVRLVSGDDTPDVGVDKVCTTRYVWINLNVFSGTIGSRNLIAVAHGPRSGRQGAGGQQGNNSQSSTLLAAGCVALMDGPEPGPADLVALGMLGLAIIGGSSAMSQGGGTVVRFPGPKPTSCTSPAPPAPPPPPSGRAPVCFRALMECSSWAAGDFGKLDLCLKSHSTCVGTNLPVIFPNGRWVPPLP